MSYLDEFRLLIIGALLKGQAMIEKEKEGGKDTTYLLALFGERNMSPKTTLKAQLSPKTPCFSCT